MSTVQCTWTTCHAPKLVRADPASNQGPAFICYTALTTPGVKTGLAFIRGRRLFKEIRYTHQKTYFLYTYCHFHGYLVEGAEAVAVSEREVEEEAAMADDCGRDAC